MFTEDREREAKELKKGLSLARLFAKPRPMWVAPAFVGLFGDAFIERTSLEGSSTLGWSYVVLNEACQRMLKNPLITNDNTYLSSEARGKLGDVLHVLNQSADTFALMVRLHKTPNHSQLLNVLRKIKKQISSVRVGESLLLPALVEGTEMALLLERTTERLYRLVVVQTSVSREGGGLAHHASSASVAMPDIKYRNCLVLNGIQKRNALDDVFWMSLYNLTLRGAKGDMQKFYDILLPFLTEKPLEASLVEAERAALAHATTPTAGNLIELCGEWRSPQRSETAYVRCVQEAMNYMLRRRGLTELEADYVRHYLLYTIDSERRSFLLILIILAAAVLITSGAIGSPRRDGGDDAKRHLLYATGQQRSTCVLISRQRA